MTALETVTATAREWAAREGCAYAVVPCGNHYAPVPASTADDLYPGRAVARCQPKGAK